MKQAVYYLLVVTLTMMSNSTVGQTVIKDTLYLSKHKVTNLVITEPVFTSSYGHGIVVASNGNTAIAEKEDLQIISLSARKKFKTPTHISIATTTNIFYDLTCIYNEVLTDAYFYIDPKGILKTQETSTTAANNDPDAVDVVVASAQKKDSIISNQVHTYYADTVRYKEIAKRLYSTKTKRVKHNVNSVEKVILRFIGGYALKDKLYLKFSIYNGGSLPFLIDKWEYSVKKKGGFDYQEIARYTPEPIYECTAAHTSILPNKTLTKVFVFDQFALDTHQSLYVQLIEKELLRSPITLEIKNKNVNKAFPVE